MNTAPITSFLEEQLGDQLVAAFIYGSVAADRAGPGSDIDCFVITVGEIAPDRRHQVTALFAELQRALGFTPDPKYPVEIFSVAACESMLTGTVLEGIVREAARTGAVTPGSLESDDVEVFRALLDRRLILRDGPVFDQLTSRADALLGRHAADSARILRSLGLSRGSS